MLAVVGSCLFYPVQQQVALLGCGGIMVIHIIYPLYHMPFFFFFFPSVHSLRLRMTLALKVIRKLIFCQWIMEVQYKIWPIFKCCNRHC